MRKLCLAALLAVLCAGAARAAPPEIETSFDYRLRWEGFDTPARSTAADRTYDLGLGRARLGLDANWQHWKLHGMLQAAGVVGVPENGAFAAGPTYLAANDGDTSPAQIGIAELNAAYSKGGFRMVLGRQPFVEGNEVATGVGHLDSVKRRRLADRLIGTLEFPSVGRRFDGASFGYGRGGAHVAAFALRPLAGAFDHEDAFEQLDGVSVAGLSVAGKHGAWLPGSELRAFLIHYEDERRMARQLTGGELDVNTVGASLLHGDDTWDFLFWGALQRGDWGASDHRAWAYLAEVGRRFPQLAGKPSVHLALEQASGDDRPGGDHGTFFNLLPTNHKFYGSMDYFAFQNLRDLYLEVLASPASRLNLRLALHGFALSEESDAWYGGSGAFERESFGFAPRLPSSGRYPDKDLGREADLDLTWIGPQGLQVGLGGGYFWGGDAAEAFLPVEADGSWVYVELTWKR